jgi:diguanylate cyclase (GGDEF)-like protein/PAS domain S-box-containing protein
MFSSDSQLIDDPRLTTWEWIAATDQIRWTSGQKEVYSRPVEEINTTSAWYQIVHPDDRERLRKAVERALESGEGHRERFRVIGKRGEIYWVLGHAKVFRDPDGSPRLVGLNVDVTDWIDALADSEARFSATFEQAAVGIAHVGLDGAWLNVNQRCLEIVGYPKEDLLKLTFADITHPEDLAKDWALVHELIRGERLTYSMEKRYFAKSGRMIWANLTVSLVRRRDGSPDYFISVIEDITARKQLEAERDELIEALEKRVRERTAELEKLTLTDPLTGIANRRCLDDRLEIEWRRAVRTRQPLSVLLIDIDHFKDLNDGFGHVTADRALVSIASGLSNLARRSSDLAARYGGDEFVMVLPETGPDGAETLARQLHEMIHNIGLCSPESPRTIEVTVSQGVATVWPDNGGSCWTVLSNADRALYFAKQSGRDRFAIHGKMIPSTER